MYASGEKIYDMLSGRENLYMCNNLVEATNKAKEITKSGQACVLSPAAASYDHFKNFEEREYEDMTDLTRKLMQR